MKFSLRMFSVKILSQPFLEAVTDKIYLKMSAGFSQTPLQSPDLEQSLITMVFLYNFSFQ